MAGLSSRIKAFPFGTRTIVTSVIVVIALIAAVALTMHFVTNEVLGTELFAAATCIASLGIVIAAVAAAIYTKPDYIRFREELRPLQIATHSFSLKDSYGRALATRDPEELDETKAQLLAVAPNLSPAAVFLVPYSPEIVIQLDVSFESSDDRDGKFLFNLFVPTEWEIETSSDRHEVNPRPTQRFVCGLEIEAKYTVCRSSLGSDAIVPFHVKLRLQSNDSPPRDRKSPMGFRMGLGPRTDPIEHEWFIEVVDGTTSVAPMKAAKTSGHSARLASSETVE